MTGVLAKKRDLWCSERWGLEEMEKANGENLLVYDRR